MKSRYDYMKEGSCHDEINDSLYPDPLSLNYNNLVMSEIPTTRKLTSDKIILFWKECGSIYGATEMDDVILDLNDVPHKNFLKPEQTLYFPKIEDIDSSFSRDR